VSRLQAECEALGIRFSIAGITPRTFRHSYAMHLLYSGASPQTLQEYMGHRDFKSTQVYTRIRALEVGIGGRYGVQFGMDAQEATALLRRAGQIDG
jgi:integrase